MCFVYLLNRVVGGPIKANNCVRIYSVQTLEFKNLFSEEAYMRRVAAKGLFPAREWSTKGEKQIVRHQAEAGWEIFLWI